MGDQQNARNVTGQARGDWRKASLPLHVSTGLYTYVAAVPGLCWVAIGALACGTVMYFVYWRRGTCTYIRLKRNLGRWGIFPFTVAVNLPAKAEEHSHIPIESTEISENLEPNTSEEDLLAIPRPPEENIQRTFVGVLSSETADKLKAMFKRDYCPEIVHLTRDPVLPPECRLVICCLPKNIRQMYLDERTVFAKLITDAGLSQAMVLIIIFGEKKTPEETLYDEDIYGNVLQQGQNLYKKGCMRSPGSLSREQTRHGWSKNIALVTVDRCPSKNQLESMNKFIQDAFNDIRVQDESVRH